MVTGLRKLTVQDYHRMAASDIFAPGERVELLTRHPTPQGYAEQQVLTEEDSIAFLTSVRRWLNFAIWAALRAAQMAKDRSARSARGTIFRTCRVHIFLAFPDCEVNVGGMLRS
jgi:hypothetical protein